MILRFGSGSSPFTREQKANTGATRVTSLPRGTPAHYTQRRGHSVAHGAHARGQVRRHEWGGDLSSWQIWTM